MCDGTVDFLFYIYIYMYTCMFCKCMKYFTVLMSVLNCGGQETLCIFLFLSLVC